jgi:hypothetical protein
MGVVLVLLLDRSMFLAKNEMRLVAPTGDVEQNPSAKSFGYLL